MDKEDPILEVDKEGQTLEEMDKEGQISEVIMEVMEMEDPTLEETMVDLATEMDKEDQILEEIMEDLVTEMDALEDLDEDKEDLNVDKKYCLYYLEDETK